jgi:methylamine utilization protein MauE
VDIALRVGVGIILLAAAGAKLRSRAELPDILRGYGIAEPFARPAALGLVAAEAALGALLVAGIASLPLALAAVALGLVFVGAVLRVRAKGVRRLRCGCFGAAEHSTGFLLVRAAGFTALAGLAAAATAYGAPAFSREGALVVAVVVLALAVAALGALILALYRQVGLLTLRIGPAQAALELPGEGPELATSAPPLEDLRGRGSELVAFFSPSCRLCRELLPAVQALAREGVAVSIVDEGENPDAFRRWNVPGSPFAVHLVDGVVVAKGLVNTLEQLEGLVALGTARSVRAAA